MKPVIIEKCKSFFMGVNNSCSNSVTKWAVIHPQKDYMGFTFNRFADKTEAQQLADKLNHAISARDLTALEDSLGAKTAKRYYAWAERHAPLA